VDGRSALERAPRTHAERTGYRETSSFAHVVAFLDSLVALGAPLHLDTLGTSTQGRRLPLVILSRPVVRTPEEALELGRPIVYVQGNIHAGEVEGKEALQALVRDLALSASGSVLDSVVVLVVPIYNADGNEQLAPQAENRGEQNGPAIVGRRANAQGLDLNRDYVKAEAPETRASLRLFDRWKPDVFVDLHTTNGSYHGYALTYSPSLHPAAPLGAFTHDTVLPILRERMRSRHGFETYHYGNFAVQYGADFTTDTLREGWFTYDHRPRFGTNYYGLRRGISILSEAYSHDPFERRVKVTYAFVREILSLAAELKVDERARHFEPVVRNRYQSPAPVGWSPTRAVAVRGELAPPSADLVVSEDLQVDADSVPDEAGVPRGIRRTGRFRTLRLPTRTRYVPTLAHPLPLSYLLGPGDSVAVALLRRHGVWMIPVGPERGPVERFLVDSVTRAGRPFQGHLETRVFGRWLPPADEAIAAGSWIVPTSQSLGTLIAVLLEPQSDDGLATWNVFDAALGPGQRFPVGRVAMTIAF